MSIKKGRKRKLGRGVLRVRLAHYFFQRASRMYGISNVLFTLFFHLLLLVLRLKALPEDKNQTTIQSPTYLIQRIIKKLFCFCNSFSHENNITGSSFLLALARGGEISLPNKLVMVGIPQTTAGGVNLSKLQPSNQGTFIT